MFVPTAAGALVRAATLDAIRQRLDTAADMPWRARAVGAALLDEGRLSSRTTNAELSARLGRGFSVRTIRYAFGDLADRGYGKRLPGASTAECKGFLPPLWHWFYDYVNDLPPVISIHFSGDNSTGEHIIDSFTGEIMGSIEHGRAPCARADYWSELHSRIEVMTPAQLGEMRYHCIYMRRLEEARESNRARFWRIQEYIYAGALAERGIIQPSVILLRLRTAPIRMPAPADDELKWFARQFESERR